MKTIRLCSTCGAPLTTTVEGECPQCLLRRGLGTVAGPEGTVHGTTGRIVQPQVSPSPKPGEPFGGYRIVRLLGKGGMGEVYEADHLESGRRVALKVMQHALASPTDEKRFLREGRLAASISHPNVVYIYGSEEIEGRPVIAMELVPEGTLKDLVRRRGPLPIPEAVDAILQVIDGLEAAHVAGILHRDIKPANCFVGRDSHVKVGDFGLSISTLARGESFQTASGTLLGTPAFASPEQLRGQELDVASDIYSVGATLYFLLTGKHPVEEQSLITLITAVLDRVPESPRHYRSEIPEGLAKIVLRCLAKERKQRFASYAELRDALLPFRAEAPAPAMLGLRFVAGLLDDLLANIPFYAVFAWIGWDPITNILQHRTWTSAGTWLACFAWTIAYWSISEGLFGAGFGKALCGLRVVGPDRQPPGVGKAALRGFIYTGAWSLPVFAVMPFIPAHVFADQLARGDWVITDWLWLPVWILLFSTMRRRNGFAALQDLLTGTRVVLKPRAAMRPKLELAAAPESTNAPTRQVGPYAVLRVLRQGEGKELLLGFDALLHRKVWIHVLPAGTPPVPVGRRDIGRAGRLRWLNGRRSESECWDAYEALEGAPLLNLMEAPHRWSAVRFWLLDLAEELSAAAGDGSLPSRLGLERVWITANGRAVLLDFPAPELRAPAPARELFSLDPTEPRAAEDFLNQVAVAALERRVVRPEERAGTAPAIVLPLHAQSFLRSLQERAFPALETLAGTLRSLTTRMGEISPRRRFGSLVFPLSLLLFSVLGARIIVAEMHRWDSAWAKEFPGRTSLREVLQAYEYDLTDPNVDRAFRLYLQQHYRELLADDAFWERPANVSMFSRSLREFARSARNDPANPDPDELAAAEKIVHRSIGELREFEELQFAWITFALFWVGCTMLGIVELFGAVFFRVDPILRLFGIAVVDGRGRRVSRLRLCARMLLAWSPAFAGGVISVVLAIMAGFGHAGGVLIALGVLALLGLLVILAAAYAIRFPERGLQDHLAGTFLVPR